MSHQLRERRNLQCEEVKFIINRSIIKYGAIGECDGYSGHGCSFQLNKKQDSAWNHMTSPIDMRTLCNRKCKAVFLLRFLSTLFGFPL